MEERFAIPEFRGRVSPVFDAALRVLLYEHRDGQIRTLGLEEAGSVPPGRRPAWLRELGVELLICGGISRPLAWAVKHQGIRLIPWVAGEIELVVQAYQEGRLLEPLFRGPGCGGSGGGRRRRGRGAGESDCFNEPQQQGG